MSNVNFIKSLEKIGTKLSDFEEVPDREKNLKYTILGKGNFGYAEKMKSKKNNLYYAIKKLDKNKVDLTNFYRETEIMFTLKHENIVKFYGYFEDKENITKYSKIYNDNPYLVNEKNDRIIYCLVLEYVPKGSLNDQLIKLKDKMKTNPIRQSFIIKIFKQLLNVLVYLFDKSIMHRDIKPDNILLDEKSNVKVSDFGLSALYKDKNPENKDKPNYLFGECTVCGRNDFISPEIKKGERYDYGSDIFSLGLTMLCLMSTENPIKMERINNSPKFLRKININLINPSYNKNLKELVLLMIKDDPNMRPDAKQAYNILEEIENMIYGKKLNRNLTEEKFTNIFNSHKKETTSKNTDNYPYQRFNTDKKILNNLYPFSPANSLISNIHNDAISVICENPQDKIFKNTSLIRV